MARGRAGGLLEPGAADGCGSSSSSRLHRVPALTRMAQAGERSRCMGSLGWGLEVVGAPAGAPAATGRTAPVAQNWQILPSPGERMSSQALSGPLPACVRILAVHAQLPVSHPAPFAAMLHVYAQV